MKFNLYSFVKMRIMPMTDISKRTTECQILAILIGLSIIVQLLTCMRADARSANEDRELKIYQQTGKLTKKCDIDCDAIVNKCIFRGKCTCDFKKDPSCTKDCVDCLEEKFGFCCHCLKGLCSTEKSKKPDSHLGTIEKYDQNYFEVLTEDDDIHGRWRVVREPKTFEFPHPRAGTIELAHRSIDDRNTIVSHDKQFDIKNCTAAYINRPLSLKKCARSCTVMGASYYRWFHKYQCCECIGFYCFSQGFEEPHCVIDNY